MMTMATLLQQRRIRVLVWLHDQAVCVYDRVTNRLQQITTKIDDNDDKCTLTFDGNDCIFDIVIYTLQNGITINLRITLHPSHLSNTETELIQSLLIFGRVVVNQHASSKSQFFEPSLHVFDILQDDPLGRFTNIILIQ